MNNIGQPNKLFKILDNGVLKQIPLDVGLEPDGYGTGAAVADIKNDRELELLVSHGESKDQPLSLYKAKVNPDHKYLRIKRLDKYGAPARGATVTLISDLRKHSKTIDAGSGYLCQMEPVAHYGIRKKEKNIRIQIKWTNGKTKTISNTSSINCQYLHTVVKDNLAKLAVVVSLETKENSDIVKNFGKQLSMHIAASNPLALESRLIDKSIL